MHPDSEQSPQGPKRSQQEQGGDGGCLTPEWMFLIWRP